MTAPAPARPRPVIASRRRLWIVVAVVAAAIGFLLWRGLGDATMYFKTADEAVHDRSELGTRRFRLEGVVVAGSVRPANDDVRFEVAENGASVPVRHHGDPPELFKEGIPVVLEGRWERDVFASDAIMVRHTSEYRAEHPERVNR